MRIRDSIGNFYIPSTISKKLLFAHACNGKSIWAYCASSIRTTMFKNDYGVHVDEYIKRR